MGYLSQLRFANVDFALLSGLQRWLCLMLHISGYDVNCQYQIHFRERMASHIKWAKTGKHTNIGLQEPPRTIFGIGNFHLPCHKADCRYKHSFHLLPCSAMCDMEASERVWAAQNSYSDSTREMSSGHRKDMYNMFHSDQNYQRNHRLRECDPF